MSINRLFSCLVSISAILAFLMSVSAANAEPMIEAGNQFLDLSVGWIGNSVNIPDEPLHSLRQSNFSLETAPIDQTVSSDDNGYSVSLGYALALKESWLWGMQVGYKYLGRVGYKGFIGDFSEDPPVIDDSQEPIEHDYKSYAIDALITGKYVTSSGLNFGLKFGIARVDTEQFINDYHFFRNNAGDDDLDVDVHDRTNYSTVNYRPEFILGAGWMPNNHINIYVEFGRIANSFGSLFKADDRENSDDNYGESSGGSLVRSLVLPVKLTFTTMAAGVSFIL